MNVKAALEATLRKQLEFLVNSVRASEDVFPALQRKKELFAKREAEIVKCNADIRPLRNFTMGARDETDYMVHFQYLIRQHDLIYMEEENIHRRITIENNKVTGDIYVEEDGGEGPSETLEREVTKKGQGYKIPYKYNRLEAVKYAEAWWNGRNPAYKNFQDNCTNFVSQCLHAGDCPMNGYPSVRKGWWQQRGQWSWSWSVAHSFYWYLTGETTGLRAVQVEKPEELLLGDVIAYDFEDDGRWNHTTIVTAKDANGMPLVNAHSADSRRRYWAYEDSSKYTTRMKYKFFHIVDND